MPCNRRPLFFALLLSLFLARFVGNSVTFADDWRPVSLEELKMTSVPEAPGAPAVILYRQVDQKDKLFTESRQYNYVRVKILTEEGRSFGTIEIPFDKGTHDVSGIRARTIQPAGKVINFSGEVFEKTIVKAKGFNFVAKEFTMPDVQVGSIIDYQYYGTVSERKSAGGWWLSNSSWVLNTNLFTRYAKFSMDAYTEHNVRVHYFWPAGLPQGVKEPEEQVNGIITMEARNVPAFVFEDYMPPQLELRQRVEFFYYEGRLESDPEKFWKTFAKKEDTRVQDFIGKQAFLKRVATETTSSSELSETNLRKLYDRVQKFRNLTYELYKPVEQVKQENLEEPHNVEELWNGGHAHASNLNWLFLGLARAAGFEAYPLGVSNRKLHFFNKARMDTHELANTTVLVKLSGQNKFLDPGAYLAPFGVLPWEETGVPALKLDKDGGSWLQTDLGDGDSTRTLREGDFKLAADGTLEGTLRLTYTGQEVFAHRIDHMRDDEAGRKKSLEDEVRASIPIGCEVELTNKPDWTTAAPSLVAEFHLKVPAWATSSGKRLLLPVGLFSAGDKQTFEHTDRHYAVYFEYPFSRVDDLKIALPQGWQVAATPKAETFDLKAAKYVLTAGSAGSTITLHREMKIQFVMLEQKFYPTMRSFFQAIKTKDEQQIVLQPLVSN